MTDREVMQQALGALEYHVEQTRPIDRTTDAITALREALEQPEQEPVEYQMRMRPTWEVSSWSDWKKCSRDAAEDYAKTPKLHDWEYETRKLYTTPPAQQAKPLTEGNLQYKDLYEQACEQLDAVNKELAETIARQAQRQSLTQAEVVDGFCKQPHDVQFVSVFDAGVRFAEAAHGIKGT